VLTGRWFRTVRRKVLPPSSGPRNIVNTVILRQILMYTEFHFGNQNSRDDTFREFLIKKMEEISSSETTVTIYHLIRNNT